MSDTYTVDGPSPSEIERAEDAVYAEDFAALVVVLRLQIRPMSAPENVIRWLSAVLRYGDTDDPGEQAIVDFCERWGAPKLLRALAAAMEQR